MAEVVLRHHRRKKKRMLDARRRLPIPARSQVTAALRAAMEAAPGFLLAMADVLGIPSGLHASYCTALAALDRPLGRPLAGAAAAMLLRLLSGMDPRWEGLVSLALLLAAPMVVHGRSNAVLMGYAALTVLPTALAGYFQPTALKMVVSFAAVPVSALSAPLMYRAVKALLDEERHLDSMEERVCAGFLGAMLLCGGARLLVLGVNTGVLLSAGLTLLMALHLGVGPGCGAGMIAGVTLAMQDLPVMLAVALGLGGFLAGAVNALGRRWLTCAAFVLSGMLPLLLSGTAGVGCGWAVAVVAVMTVLTPREWIENSQRLFQRFLPNRLAPGDAYAASMLAAWEKTVDAMALAVPSPVEAELPHTSQWWEEKLCDGCPDLPRCGCMNTEHAAAKAETVWNCREAEDLIWQDALEELRGLGCQRLYHLRQNMDYLRQEDAVQRRNIRRAADQRSMLVTHLTAMAGAARRFAMLSGGESWWEDMMAGRIQRELSDAALPVCLLWLRRVNGHAQAAFELQFITGARKQAEELCVLVGRMIGAPMEVTRLDGDRVSLSELPLLTAVCASCSAAIGEDGQEGVCGDTAWYGRLMDGRWMAALSDGMGHGEKAALASRQTVELLRLCLEAGYTRRQTLTAVNGMMLLSGHGERFTTVDLLTIDLWSGQAALDKLGAAGSWLYQQGMLRQVNGDALPLGIIENIESRECGIRLVPGDAVILMTDGVEEAFQDRKSLEEVVWLALEEETPEDTAHSIMDAALAAGGTRTDDQTVSVIRICSTGAVQTSANDV